MGDLLIKITSQKRFNSDDCFMTGQETYDLLIPVITWTGLTVYETLPT
jgi:hypothetical protein